jgi:hypothetical protein
MSELTVPATSELPAPKLFISYSWSSQEHQDWVLSLAEQLMNNGIFVVLDKWDLQPGHDAFAFMEKIVADPTVTKVLLICDAKYAEKSNARRAGAGMEAQIITPEIYAKTSQDKYVAIVKEKDDSGQPYLPVYYKSLIYIDLSEDYSYAAEFEKLLRWAWGKPLDVRPPLGKPPSFVAGETTSRKISTSVPFRRAVDAIRNSRATAVPATREYLDTVVSGLDYFRIEGTRASIDTFDDDIIKSIDDFLPYRHELVELFIAIASYRFEEEMVEVLHRFFEHLIPLRERPEDKSSYYEIDSDNLKFITQETFLCCIAALIKYERFKQASFLIDNEYYCDSKSGKFMHAYAVFDDNLTSFDLRNKRLGLNRLSLRTDVLNQRAESGGLNFRYIMTADCILYLRSLTADDSEIWYPETLSQLSFRSRGPLEMFARCKSKKYFDHAKLLLGVSDKAALIELIKAVESNAGFRIPRWDYRRLNLRALLQLETMATTP